MKLRDIQEIVKYEVDWYYYYLYHNKRTKLNRLISMIKNDNIRNIAIWQKYSRYTDYYKIKMNNSSNFFYKILYIYCLRKKNSFGQKLGIEVDTTNIGKGLKICHNNVVINSCASIGDNLMLLGDNVIGNGGPHKLGCPIIGNNIILGAGAKIIGPITLADDIIIAAGAIVVNSFYEKGITIGGIPAKKIK